MNKALQTLIDRGFVKDCTDFDGLSDLMDKESISFYCGVDPTGPSLHVGHIVPFFAMHHLQSAGHNPIALVGGGTGLIGDPSGKTEMRKILSVEDINSNVEKIKAQLGKIVDFSDNPGEGMGKARMMGVDVPISAGIMPIVNSRQIERTVALSGASLPHDFTKMIGLYENEPEALFEAGIEYASEQIRDLITNGVDGIHLYIMNNAEVGLRIYDNIKDLLA